MYIQIFNKFIKDRVEKLFYINNYIATVLETQLNCSVFLESKDRKNLKFTKKNLDRMHAELETYGKDFFNVIKTETESIIIPITIRKFKLIIRNLISAIHYILNKEVKNTMCIKSTLAFSYIDNDFLTDYLIYLNCSKCSIINLTDILEKHNVYEKTTLTICP